MKSVFTKEEPGEMPTLEPKVNSDQHIDEAHFTIQDVAAKLKDLKIDKSPGMEGIHTRVLK